MGILLLFPYTTLNRHIDKCLPGNEAKVGIRVLVPHQPRSITTGSLLLLLEMLFQYTSDAHYLLLVTVFSTVDLLGMILVEPDPLSVVWALPRHLEKEPLFGVVVLWSSGSEAELVLRVVLVGDVLEDSTRLPQSDVRVGVVNSWHAPVGVDGEVFGLLEVGEPDILNLVGDAEFPKDHGDFWRVWAHLTPNFDWLDRRHGTNGFPV